MNVKVEIDNEDDQTLAIYITLSEGTIRRTVEIDPGCNVDEDEQGKPLGVEILSTQEGDVARSIAGVKQRYPTDARLQSQLDAAIGKIAV